MKPIDSLYGIKIIKSKYLSKDTALIILPKALELMKPKVDFDFSGFDRDDFKWSLNYGFKNFDWRPFLSAISVSGDMKYRIIIYRIETILDKIKEFIFGAWGFIKLEKYYD